MQMHNFRPLETKSATNADSTSRSVQFVADGARTEVTDCCVTNDTDKVIYVKFGKGSAATAVAGSDMPIRSGAQIVLGKDQCDYCSYVCDAGVTATGRVSFTAGVGN